MFHEHVSYPFVFTIAVSRRSRPRFLPSRKRPLLARLYSYNVISRSCLYLNGAQEVEGWATNSLRGGMNFGSASAEWFPGLDPPPSSNIHRLSNACKGGSYESSIDHRHPAGVSHPGYDTEQLRSWFRSTTQFTGTRPG